MRGRGSRLARRVPPRWVIGLAVVSPLLAGAPAGAQSPASLPGARVQTLVPRVQTLVPRVATLTPRVVSVAPKQTGANTFQVGTDVLFAFDSSQLSPDAQAVLSGVIARIRSARAGIVTITGYTDSIGKATYNLALSRRRAASVLAFMQPRVGSGKLRYRARGLGEADPVAPNTLPSGRDNPDGRQRNRRVVITLAPS